MSILFLLATAYAIPLELSHSGRLIDPTSGAPLSGAHTVDVTLYDAPSSGTVLWTDSFSLSFDDGYYVARLGSGAALSAADLDHTSVWMGIAIDGGAELSPRQELGSVPYAVHATRAEVATSVSGGVVDASEIRVDGNVVIDGSGGLVGASGTLAGLSCTSNQVPLFDGTDWTCTGAASTTVVWNDIVGIPSDILDGDDDTDTTLSDSDIAAMGYVKAWDDLLGIPSGFADGIDDDTTLDEAAVDGFVANNGYAIASDLHALATSGAWADLQGVPGDLADGDDVLDEAGVEAFIENGGLDLNGAFTTSGIVQIGNDSTLVCDASAAGTLRWNNDQLELCVGDDWVVMASQSPRGTGPNDAIVSCQTLKTEYPGTPSGVYWIDPDDDNDAVQTWCEMSGTDGWTLVAHKVSDSYDIVPDAAQGLAGSPAAVHNFKLHSDIIDDIQAVSGQWRFDGKVSGRTIYMTTNAVIPDNLVTNEYRRLRYMLAGVGLGGCGANTWTNPDFYPATGSPPSPSCWAYPTTTNFYDFDNNASGSNGNGVTIWLR